MCFSVYYSGIFGHRKSVSCPFKAGNLIDGIIGGVNPLLNLQIGAKSFFWSLEGGFYDIRCGSVA